MWEMCIRSKNPNLELILLSSVVSVNLSIFFFSFLLF